MTNDRPKIGFVDELENFDPSGWQPGATAPRDRRPLGTEAAVLAEASGFVSREPKATSTPERPVRRRRTGRNTQFNIKADPAVIERFTEISDIQGWVFGETLEHAVNLLEQHLRQPNSNDHSRVLNQERE